MSIVAAGLFIVHVAMSNDFAPWYQQLGISAFGIVVMIAGLLKMQADGVL